jgi:hypothetical protein
VVGPLPLLNSNGSTYPEQVLHEACVESSVLEANNSVSMDLYLVL